jgi:hypothetical protein
MGIIHIFARAQWSGNDWQPEFYNNVFYTALGINSGPLIFQSYLDNQYPLTDITMIDFKNNIVINNGLTAFPAYGSKNIYWGNIAQPLNDNFNEDPMLVNPGSGGIGLNSVDGYKLQDGSPAIGKGVRMPGMDTLDYFGGIVQADAALDIGVQQHDAVTASKWPAPYYKEAEVFFKVGPNPFKRSTMIRFEQPAPRRMPGANQFARVSIYSAKGALVATLLCGVVAPGKHQVVWNAGKMPTGIYEVRLQMGKTVMQKRIVRAK